MGLSPAATGRAVDALVRAGLVTRRDDDADRRVKRLALTHDGHSPPSTASPRRASKRSPTRCPGLDADQRDALAAALAPLLPDSPDGVCAQAAHAGGTSSMSSPQNGAAAAPAKVFDKALISVAIVVVLGTFMSILDTTIVNVAINTLSKDFNTDLATIQWVSTGYMLALATVIPLTGWAADRFGTKRLYIISISLFLVGSALSGAAWSAGSLIAFRILQGLGGGMIMPAGMTILSKAAGPQRMGRVMGIVGVPMLMGPIIGPILGGWLVDDVSWRWIFYVNIPVGAVALIAATRLLPRDKPPRDREARLARPADALPRPRRVRVRVGRDVVVRRPRRDQGVAADGRRRDPDRHVHLARRA